MRTSTRQADQMVSAPFVTPWGQGRVFVAASELAGVALPPGVGPGPAAAESGGPVSAADAAALEHWVRELEAYFRGDRAGWKPEEVPVDSLAAGLFERAVLAALLAVPPATTVSYGELARSAGFPRAARAVGNVMASNPVPVVVPCHRVIRSDGSLGRYGDDPAWKERLLDHERRWAGASRPSGGRCRS